MNFFFLIFYIIFVLSLSSVSMAEIKAQNIDPTIQAKIDSLNIWIKKQIETTGTIDQKQLDSMNQLIKEAQLNLNVKTNNVGNENIIEKQQQETGKLIIRDMMPGSTFIVPEGVKWKIKRISCKTEMGGYSVLVTSIKLKELYEAGEKISMPAFTPEASLLTEDSSSVIYTFEIFEIPKPK